MGTHDTAPQAVSGPGTVAEGAGVKEAPRHTFSVVVSTLGRTQSLLRLLDSLDRQLLRDCELVIVDQNEDDQLVQLLTGRSCSHPVTHVRIPDQRGLSRGRNVGWRIARGRYVVFADDGCWYPPWLLARVSERLKATDADIMSGRAADEAGRSINGRYERSAQRVGRGNVWTTSIEWMIFFRRGALETVGGFDENLGIGAGTPWQAAEGQDILLRAIEAGFEVQFDPSLYGFHAEFDVGRPDAAMRSKAHAHGRGMGYVLFRHGFGPVNLAYWVARPSAAAVVFAILGRRARARYHLNVARGRLEGWRAADRYPRHRPVAAANAVPSLSACKPMRLLVGIATVGRRGLLSETLAELARQSRLPDRVIVCASSSADVDKKFLSSLPFPTALVISIQGSSPQRNAILREAGDAEAIVFFDDDFFPDPSYLANTVSLLLSNPSIVLATGKLIEDGISGPGLDPAHARQRLASSPVRASSGAVLPYYGAYGCNMVVRLAPVREHRILFDETLPLYAWQEDTDFSRQLAPFGKIIQAEALTGVHLGTKRGRTSGIKFGYSQIANPIYLMSKGTMSVWFGSRMIAKNLIANLVRLARPEPHVDRLGRCKGNMLALSDLTRGRLHPQRILELD